MLRHSLNMHLRRGKVGVLIIAVVFACSSVHWGPDAENNFRSSPSPMNENVGGLVGGKAGGESEALLKRESRVTDSDKSDCIQLARTSSLMSKELAEKLAGGLCRVSRPGEGSSMSG